MVNAILIETILREQDNPGCSTTRQIRDLYNSRSGEDPIVQNSDVDQEFQTILIKAIQTFPIDDDDDDDVDEEDKPISYTVKLKDSDDVSPSQVKRRSIIKLPKEAKEQSESEETSSDSEKPSTATSVTLVKPFSPLFLNNMKKFGVSTDWLAKRSNLLRQAAYSRSSVESNTSKLDAMIKSASTKPVRSNRKLSFVETTSATTTPTKIDADKENKDPETKFNEDKKEEPVEETKPEEEEPIEEVKPGEEEPKTYDFSSEVEEEKENEDEKDNDASPDSKAFSLRIPRVNVSRNEIKKTVKRVKSPSPSLSSDEESKKEKVKPKRKRKSKKDKNSTDALKNLTETEKKDEETAANDDSKSTSQKSKESKEQLRIEHLKKYLRTAGIRFMIKKIELDEFKSNKAKIDYLKSLFDKAGFTGSLSIKECEKFRKKRDTEKELLEIQASAAHVEGHVKGGRTLRGQGRNTNDEIVPTAKRKRQASSEIEDNEAQTNDTIADNDRKITKKQRIMTMEASPEVSENE